MGSGFVLCDELAQHGVVLVFLGQLRVLDWPGNGDFRAVPRQSAFILRKVKVGAFVVEVSKVRQNTKTVGIAWWDPQLLMVLIR